MEYKTDIKLRYAETDQMGMIHHSAFVIYLEEARVSHLSSLGLPYHRLESEGLFLPVIRLEIDYRKPVRFGQPLSIFSRFLPLKGARISVAYRGASDGVEVLVAASEHAFIDRRGRPLRPPREFVEKVGV